MPSVGGHPPIRQRIFVRASEVNVRIVKKQRQQNQNWNFWEEILARRKAFKIKDLRLLSGAKYRSPQQRHGNAITTA
jgi:hypothetical protein